MPDIVNGPAVKLMWGDQPRESTRTEFGVDKGHPRIPICMSAGGRGASRLDNPIQRKITMQAHGDQSDPSNRGDRKCTRTLKFPRRFRDIPFAAEDLIGLLSLAAFSVNCSMIQAPMQKVSENTELEIAENDEEWQHEQVALAAETDRLFHMTCFGSIATPWFAALQRRRGPFKAISIIPLPYPQISQTNRRKENARRFHCLAKVGFKVPASCLKQIGNSITPSYTGQVTRFSAKTCQSTWISRNRILPRQPDVTCHVRESPALAQMRMVSAAVVRLEGRDVPMGEDPQHQAL
ncbi:hypothetical protein V8E54_005506 [Elaphomyces granulatus]